MAAPRARAPRLSPDTPSTKPLVDRLGVRAGMRVIAAGIDEELRAQVVAAGASLAGPRARDVDIVLLRAATPAELARVARLKAALSRTGALWIIRPRGHPDVTERSVMHAGQLAGLVDVKIARVSDSDTAMKFVYRLKDRR